MDGNPASEILTLTFEVIFSKKSYIHRSLVHSSARDQLRNFDQFEVIFLRNTMCGCRTASLVFKIFLGFLEIFRYVFIPTTLVSEILVLILRPYF